MVGTIDPPCFETVSHGHVYIVFPLSLDKEDGSRWRIVFVFVTLINLAHVSCARSKTLCVFRAEFSHCSCMSFVVQLVPPVFRAKSPVSCASEHRQPGKCNLLWWVSLSWVALFSISFLFLSHSHLRYLRICLAYVKKHSTCRCPMKASLVNPWN